MITEEQQRVNDLIASRQRFERWWLPGWLVDPRRRCTHPVVRRLHGDEIMAARYRRNRCLTCGRLW